MSVVLTGRVLSFDDDPALVHALTQAEVAVEVIPVAT